MPRRAMMVRWFFKIRKMAHYNNILTAIIGTAQYENEHQRKKIEANALICANCPKKAYIGIKISPYNSQNAHHYKCTQCTCSVAKRILSDNCPINKFIDNG